MIEWIDIPTAAERMNVSEKTIRNFIKSGLIPAFRFGPHLIRISAVDLASAMVPISPDELS